MPKWNLALYTSVSSIALMGLQTVVMAQSGSSDPSILRSTCRDESGVDTVVFQGNTVVVNGREWEAQIVSYSDTAFLNGACCDEVAMIEVGKARFRLSRSRGFARTENGTSIGLGTDSSVLTCVLT